MTKITYIPNRVIDADGISDGASLYVYQSGTNTLVDLFSDEDFTSPTTNPVVVPAGAPVPAFYTDYTGPTRLRVVAADGSVPSDEDPYEPVGSYIPNGTGAISRSFRDEHKLRINVRQFGAKGDGTNDSAAINFAFVYARSIPFEEKEIVFPAGNYWVDQLNLEDQDYLNIRAEGTVNITGNDGSKGFIIGSNRFDRLGHTTPDEGLTYGVRMTGGPWLVGPAPGEVYDRALKLQNIVDSVFENVGVSGSYGAAGDRVAVEFELSFNNAFYNCNWSSPGAPFATFYSYAIKFGSDNCNNNRFYNFRSAGVGYATDRGIAVHLEGNGNSFYGADFSAYHTVFKLNGARGCQLYNYYCEAVTRVVNITFLSKNCVLLPSHCDIMVNGTAYDLGSTGNIQNENIIILGGNHKFNAVGTTGIKYGTNTYLPTIAIGYDSAYMPAVKTVGTPNGDGGLGTLDTTVWSGAGFIFPNTPVPSTNPTMLDAYKEGNGTLTSAAGVVLTTGTYRYTKIGNSVRLSFKIVFPVNADNVNDARVVALPFSAHASDRSGASPGLESVWPADHAVVVAAGNLYVINKTTGALLKNQDVSGKTYTGSVTYEATS